MKTGIMTIRVFKEESQKVENYLNEHKREIEQKHGLEILIDTYPVADDHLKDDIEVFVNWTGKYLAKSECIRIGAVIGFFIAPVFHKDF